MLPTFSYNAGESPSRTIATLLEPLDYRFKKPLLEAIVKCKNEAVEKALMGLESSAVEVNAEECKRTDDAENASALTGAVDENDLGAPANTACENRKKLSHK